MQWIEYHRLLGVEHFYIYDNGSEDAILPRLHRYMAAGIVTYILWPFKPDEGMHWNQVRAGAPVSALPRQLLCGPRLLTCPISFLDASGNGWCKCLLGKRSLAGPHIWSWHGNTASPVHHLKRTLVGMTMDRLSPQSLVVTRALCFWPGPDP